MRSGFTLAEATIALVILGMAAAGVLLPFSSGAAVQAEGLRVTLAAKLANDLLERIIATPTGQIVPTTEAQGQVTDASGNVFTDAMYANFSRQVVCVDFPVLQESGDLPSHFIRVSIHVGYQGREIATLSRLISK
jgi:prepilin-type N-terminal cleavage/methylation domain-containing protein